MKSSPDDVGFNERRYSQIPLRYPRNYAKVLDKAKFINYAKIYGDSKIYCLAKIHGDAVIKDHEHQTT